jgi:aminobenzoyl-glutamate transport protein
VGAVRSARDVIDGMSRTMSGLGYYLVLTFFAAQFIAAFAQSNLGALVALKGAGILTAAEVPMQVTVAGLVLMTAAVNVLIGSAGAKWALLAPIVVPLFMNIGLSPDLAQAAYRIGDSSTNIVSPLMPFFPIVVVFCQRYVKASGVGTVFALMIPYALVFLCVWTLWLLAYWGLGLPLGLGARYDYP